MTCVFVLMNLCHYWKPHHLFCLLLVTSMNYTVYLKPILLFWWWWCFAAWCSLVITLWNMPSSWLSNSPCHSNYHFNPLPYNFRPRGQLSLENQQAEFTCSSQRASASRDAIMENHVSFSCRGHRAAWHLGCQKIQTIVLESVCVW